MSGSDLEASELTEDLEREGVLMFRGHSTSNIGKDVDLVIYSAAVTKTNPEFKEAKLLKIKIQSYPQALGALTKKYFTIAISGSHGKSTTTALIGLILTKAGLDPTVIVGTKLREFNNSNFRKGASKYLVIEADEWNKSFHYYFPKMIILTNIDKEHLDTYKTFNGVVAGFARYLKNLAKGGFLIANWQDTAIRKLAVRLETIDKRLKTDKRRQVIFYNHGKFQKHPLAVPGKHNQVNAEAAWRTFGVIANNANLGQNNANLRKIANEVFWNYTGAWRRLEILTSYFLGLNSIVYSDYAHHPTEIKATLAALREQYQAKKIVCVFQPHQQDRLTRLFKEFTLAFSDADEIIIMPVYKVAGREYNDSVIKTDSFALAQKISEHQKKVFYARDLEAVLKLLKKGQDGGVIVFMGAGDLDSQIRQFLVK